MAHNATSSSAQGPAPASLSEYVTAVDFSGTMDDLRRIRALLKSALKEIEGTPPHEDILEIEFPRVLKCSASDRNLGAKIRAFISILRQSLPSRAAKGLPDTKEVDKYFEIFNVKRKHLYGEVDLYRGGVWVQGTLPSGQNICINVPVDGVLGMWYEGMSSDIQCPVCYQCAIYARFPCSVPQRTHGLCITCYDSISPKSDAEQVVSCALCRQQHRMEDLKEVWHQLEALIPRLETPGHKLDLRDEPDSVSAIEMAENEHLVTAGLILSTALLRQHIAKKVARVRATGSEA